MLDEITWDRVSLGRQHTIRNLLPRGFCVTQAGNSAFLFVATEVLQIDLVTKHVQLWRQRANAPPGPEFHTGSWGVFVRDDGAIVAVSNQSAFKLVTHGPLLGPHTPPPPQTPSPQPAQTQPPQQQQGGGGERGEAEGPEEGAPALQPPPEEVVVVEAEDHRPEYEWQRLPLFGRCWNSTWVPGGVLHKNKVYCFGGFDTSRLWSLDLSAHPLHWQHEPVTGEAPAPRFDHSCTIVTPDGAPHLLIHGGRTTAGILFTDAHLLHLETMEWRQLELGGHPLPKTPYGAALAVGGYLYAFGQTLYSKPHALRIDLERSVCNRLYPWYTPSDNQLGMPCVALFCRGHAWAFGVTAPSAGEDWVLSCHAAVLPVPPWSPVDHLRFSPKFHTTAKALVLANSWRHHEGDEDLALPADLLGNVLEYLPNL